MHAAPRYSEIEIERRWLVPTDSVLHKTSVRERTIEDRYILETRLRLRKVTEPSQPPIYKLGKKYEPKLAGTHQCVSTYLSRAEYEVLAHLPARVARKRRLSVHGGALDIYESPNPGLQVFEVEFSSPEESAAYAPPPGVGAEVTNNSKYSGYALAGSAA